MTRCNVLFGSELGSRYRAYAFALKGWTHGRGEPKMQREFAIRRLAKLEGYRLERKGDDSYRLINARFKVAVYQLDGVPLEKIAAFLEKRTSQANSPDAQHR